MKKLLLFLVALVSALTASAQDVIVKTDGSTVLCKVVEVNGSAVVYLKWSDLEGPRYAIERSQISTVNYQDGRQDKMNAQTTNAYSPNNQQTGNWNYNDNSLLALDKTRNTTNPIYKKIKRLKTIGWTAGTALIVGGASLMIVGTSWGLGGGDDGNLPFIAGTILTAGGIGTLTACLLRAKQLKKQMGEVSCAPVYQHDFKLGNGKSLAAGVDILRDNQFKNTALGVGLKLNF